MFLCILVFFLDVFSSRKQWKERTDLAREWTFHRLKYVSHISMTCQKCRRTAQANAFVSEITLVENSTTCLESTVCATRFALCIERACALLSK